MVGEAWGQGVHGWWVLMTGESEIFFTHDFCTVVDVFPL